MSSVSPLTLVDDPPGPPSMSTSSTTSPSLTDAIVGSHELLADTLQPLLIGKSASFTYVVPAVRREAGGWTKPFPFTVARRSVAHLLSAHAATLFPDKFRQAPHSMSAQQAAAYHAWSDAERLAYAMVYSKEEWAANAAQCRRVYKTTNKATNQAKKRKWPTGVDDDSDAKSSPGESDILITPTSVTSGDLRVPLETSCHASCTPEIGSGGCQGEVCSPDELFRAFVQSLGIHGRLTPQAAAILNTTSQHLGMRMSVPIPMAAADTPNPFYEVSSNHSADSSLERKRIKLSHEADSSMTVAEGSSHSLSLSLNVFGPIQRALHTALGVPEKFRQQFLVAKEIAEGRWHSYDTTLGFDIYSNPSVALSAQARKQQESQQQKQPLLSVSRGMEMVRHAGHSSHLQHKIRTVLHIIAQNFPHQLAANFPGVTHVPFVTGVRSLPMLIQTHFLHASEGNATAYAILWFTDSPHLSSVPESNHGDTFEYFFYAPDGRRRRSLFIHEIIAVEPNSGVLSSFVGKWFSSFNNSQGALGSSGSGWRQWLSLDEEELNMATITRTVGFRNHPEILASQLEDLTEVEMPWDPIADSELTGDPEEDAHVRTGPAIVRAYPDSWPLRDAMACMCEHECNPIDCNPSQATKNLRLPICTLYHSVADVIKVAPAKGGGKTDKRELKREVDAYECCFGDELSPRIHFYGPLPSKLKRPKHTMELERERPVVAHDVTITMLRMDATYDLLLFSRRHLSDSVLLKKLRSRIPLFAFFQLFGKTILSARALQGMVHYSRRRWLPSGSSQLSDVVVLDNQCAFFYNRTCVVPSSAYQEFEHLQRSSTGVEFNTPATSTLTIEEI